MPKTIALLVLVVAATSAAAQTYKWKDASGTMQYSDTPPPSNAKDVQQLRKVPGPASSGPATSTQTKSTVDAEAEFRKRMAARQDAETKQAKAQEEEQVRADTCLRAKNRLTALESGRVARFDDKGERILLDDDQREREKVEVRKVIDSACK